MPSPARLRRVLAVLVLALLAAPACRDGRSPVEPLLSHGEVTARLISATGAEGTAALEMQASEWNSTRSENSQLFLMREGDTSRVVILLGKPGELQLQTHLSLLAGAPSLKLVDVGDGESRLRSTVSGRKTVFPPVAP
jgi:hypothetical protein